MKTSKQKARSELIVSHLGLVHRIVIDTIFRHPGLGQHKDDMIQAATEGLIIAIDRYDMAKAKLSTYAWPWMKLKIMMACADLNNVVRVRLDGNIQWVGNHSNTDWLDEPMPESEEPGSPSRRVAEQQDESAVDAFDRLTACEILTQFLQELPSAAESMTKNNPASAELYADIYKMRVLDGMTLQAIGDKMGMSRERARYICLGMDKRLEDWCERKFEEYENA